MPFNGNWNRRALAVSIRARFLGRAMLGLNPDVPADVAFQSAPGF